MPESRFCEAGDVVGDALLRPVLVLLGYYELALAVHLAKLDERAFLFGEDGDLLRAADFKELLDARKTLRDVFSCELTDASVWKVRIVSCVPGSPIDWAATTPTDSPIATFFLVARSRP